MILLTRQSGIRRCVLAIWYIAMGVSLSNELGAAQILQPQPSTPSDLEEAQPPLMDALSRTGLGRRLEQARVNVYGWVEGSYQYNFNAPDHTPNLGRTFDVLENKNGYLNQLDLTVERKVRLDSPDWDFGGRVDIMYGSDSRFTTSSGLFNEQSSLGPSGLARQELWLDMPQAYLDINVPVGNGIRVRIGKFEFFKVIDPNSNALYTHPFEYGQAFPYTLAGASAFIPITPRLSFEVGFSRGWDQTFTDNNSAALDGFGRVVWKQSELLQITAAAITGPEQWHDNGHFTTAADVALFYTPLDRFAIALDVTYGRQAGAIFGEFPGSNSPPRPDRRIGDANWYGLTETAAFQVNEWMTLNGRLEWYRDEKGYTEGFAGQLNLYEATIGLKLYPLHATRMGDYFILRPELRYDWCSRPFFNLLNPRHDQVTLAIDAIVNF